MKYIFILFFTSLLSLCSFSQRPPETFFKGLDNLDTNPMLAKELFFKAIVEDSIFYGSYNFLGILFVQEKKYDSAINFLQTSIRLNKDNSRHTKEMTLVRLCRTYLRKGDFENSYNTALKALKEFPENQYIAYELKEICLWAYNVEYGGLSKEYLQPDIKSEYLVRSVNQEYLIMRNISVNNESLKFNGQTYNPESNTDILHCLINSTKDSVDLIFKLGWQVGETFGDNMPDYKIVYNDKNIKVWYRLGASLSKDSKVEILKEIAKLEK